MEKHSSLSVQEFLLFSSMFLYAIITKKSINALISISVLPVLFFALGDNLLHISLEMKQCWKKIVCLFGVLVVGYYIHGFFNTIKYFEMGQLVGVRHWNDFWTGIVTPATAHEVYFFPIIAIAFPMVIYLKKYRKLCIGGICALSYALFFSVISASRTPIIVVGIVLFLELLLYVLLNIDELKIKRTIKKTGIAITFFGLILALILMLFVVINKDKLEGNYIFSVLNRDGGLLGNIRFKAQLNVLKNMFVYPFGGCKIELLGLTYPHNVWLDLIYTAGIIPFFLFLGYTVLTVFDLIKLVKNENIKPEIKHIITGLYVAFVLYYMVEPALEGNVQNILPWTYLNGIMYALNKGKEIC